MKKLERIEREAQKAREKIAALQTLLKEIDGKRTEQEDLQIVRKIRALNLSRDELYAFLGNGEIPTAFLGAIGNVDAEQETIYSRRSKKQSSEPDAESTDTNDTPNHESEDMTDEK